MPIGKRKSDFIYGRWQLMLRNRKKSLEKVNPKFEKKKKFRKGKTK